MEKRPEPGKEGEKTWRVEEHIRWPRGKRGSPTGDLALRLLAKGGDVDLAAGLNRGRGRGGIERRDPEGVWLKFTQYRVGVVHLRPDLPQGAASDYSRDWLSETMEQEGALTWCLQTPHVRRAWLCLLVLREKGQRPGGYQRTDMARFAGSDSQRTGALVADRLSELGVLQGVGKPGRGWVRYKFSTGRGAGLPMAREEWERFHIRSYLKELELATEARRGEKRRPELGDRTGYRWRDLPPGWIVGRSDLMPPRGMVLAIAEALRVATMILEAAASHRMGEQIGFGHAGDAPDWKDTVAELVREYELPEIEAALKRVTPPAWRRWRTHLYNSGNGGPVFVARLFDLAEGIHTVPNEQKPALPQESAQRFAGGGFAARPVR